MRLYLRHLKEKHIRMRQRDSNKNRNEIKKKKCAKEGFIEKKKEEEMYI